jgi:hypothetical protein
MTLKGKKEEPLHCPSFGKVTLPLSLKEYYAAGEE